MALTAQPRPPVRLLSPRIWRPPGALQWLAIAAGAAAILPIAGVLFAASSGPGAGFPLADTLRYAATSAWLALLVGLLTAILGSASAWLVVMYRFPASRFFAWALALPLAAPAFALAYAYADLFDVAGPLRTGLRAWVGVDLPFELRSIGGAAFVLACAFYPYVYLAMRAALVSQSASALEAARLLGCPGRTAFLRASLPLARPALAAGVALAMMETLADYGAVQFLSVQTLTTGVVRAWSVFGSTAGAARFALPLLAAAALVMWIERRSRAGRSHGNHRSAWRPVPPRPLGGLRAAGAAAFCSLLLLVALGLPLAWLGWNALSYLPEQSRLVRAALNSLSLAAAGAALTTFLAGALAIGGTRLPMASRLASLGYATPGAAMAIGLLVPAALVWQFLPGASGYWVGVALLLYAYAARMMAAALEPIDAGLARIPASMLQAGRLLGRSDTGVALAVQLPVARGAFLTAGLIVFIDVLKELPATLILRPFDFDTLAVIASNYALDERLGQAGWPALFIVLLALPPTVWLSRKIAASRPGS